MSRQGTGSKVNSERLSTGTYLSRSWGGVADVLIEFILVSLPVYLQRLPPVETPLIGVILTAAGVAAVALMIPVGLRLIVSAGVGLAL